MKTVIARILGRIGYFFVALADGLSPNWDPPMPKYAAWLGEADEQLTHRNANTWPCAPRVPQIERDPEQTQRRMRLESPPPAIPKGERRIICVDDKQVSVTPPAGSYWSEGGRS